MSTVGTRRQLPARTVSALISEFASTKRHELVAEIDARFPCERFGLLVYGLPALKPGQQFVVGPHDHITMPIVTAADGRPMIKACADPDAFAVAHPDSFNAIMSGQQLVTMAQRVHDAEGILVCSAASFHSYAIPRSAYSNILGTTPAASRAWWRRWSWR